MRSFYALVRKDLKGYFDQPTGYILLVIFTGVVGYLFFFVSDFRTNEEASIRAMFSVQSLFTLPWLLAIFVPAATMRLLAEEQRDGTLEILLTQPIHAWNVLMAKFTAGLIFVSVAILATLGIPIALKFAGNLDDGTVVTQYVGSIFMAAAFISIGLFTSSLTRNQIVAFIMGVFLTAVLMLVGMDIVIDSLPNRVSELLLTLSPVTHFENMARGVIDLRDILYFIALISTFLSASYLMIRSKTLSHRSPQFRNLQLGVVGLIVLSLLVGWFGSSIGGRLDLSEDKLYALSQGTEDILGELDDILTVKLFASKDPPVEISVVTRDVKDFLDDFSERSGGKVRLIRRFPSDPEEDQEALLAGVAPKQFSVIGQRVTTLEEAYLGLVMTYADKRETIPFIGNSIEGFEYRIASLANKMIGDRDRKTVAFLTGHGEKSKDADLTILQSEMGKQYEVTDLPASIRRQDLAGVDVVIIAGPTEEVPRDVRGIIADYLAGGGKAMILLDPVFISQDPTTGNIAGFPNQFNFGDFLEPYGVLVEDDVVYDLQENQPIPDQDPYGSVVFKPNPYWARVPTVDPKVAGAVESVVFPWASSIGIAESQVGDVEFIPLLRTTPGGGVDSSYRDLNHDSPALEVTSGQLFAVDIGVAIESQGRSGSGDEREGAFRLVVVGDSDWLSDGWVNQNSDNLVLALNLIDWLAQEDTLAEVRSKVVTSRRLDYDSPTERNFIQYGNVAGLPTLFILIGFAAFFRRQAMASREYGREK
ncbi:MAG: Gldg family protein [SAR202 cluster bacterium]|nr:Gldg family protein [SAR202 cluster bacterium]